MPIHHRQLDSHFRAGAAVKYAIDLIPRLRAAGLPRVAVQIDAACHPPLLLSQDAYYHQLLAVKLLNEVADAILADLAKVRRSGD